MYILKANRTKHITNKANQPKGKIGVKNAKFTFTYLVSFYSTMNYTVQHTHTHTHKCM